ncbi:MAG TPA: malto-oligosyltrehalose trehalohydrolase [Gemmatimonadaceae bacterium]|nr:malto-oligosyltrehalose trehalohydrolase [Gemmatimonadaceae bacterium]
MSSLWSLGRGATALPDGGVRFCIWAPKAKRADVVMYGKGKESSRTLDDRGGGIFEGIVHEARAGTRYRFRLDGAEPVPDPVSRYQPDDVHGASQVVDPREFRWTDDGWKGLDVAALVIYELHVGTFTEGGTFDSAIERLQYLKELGITAIEIMPVGEFPGGRNWGYDGVQLYAPESGYGGPEGLRRLVDAAHRTGLAVVLDVVYNHVGPEGNYLGAYGPYFTEKYRTPWGSAVNYDDADSDEVRRFVIENALYWVTEFHVDALRLDAIHGIFDFGARHLLEELGSRVREQAQLLGRRAVVIGESDLNDPKVVRPADRGGWALDAHWSDDLHHAIHAALTGETKGYYADFGGVDPIAKALGDRYVYDGRYSKHRRRHHGAPATDVSAEHFVVCIQNHDQVGNRAAGERFGELLAVEDQRLAAALLLLSPYVPLLFMGEEYGETNPFQYFVSHGDEKLVEAVRTGRRKEFESFGWADDVPDPQSEDTFRRSKLDWSKLERAPNRELHALYRELLRLRRSEPALRPGAARVRVDHGGGESPICVELTADRGAALFAVFNLSRVEHRVALPRRDGAWTLALSTASTNESNTERPVAPHTGGRVERELVVPARSAALCREDRK